MAAKTTAYANSLLLLIFNATTFTNVAINATGSPITSVFFALHTADPGPAAGDQTTNEMTTGAYDTYARTGKLRASGAGGYTVTTNSVSPFEAVTFPAGTGGSGATASFFSVGSLVSGAGVRFYSGAISPTISCGNGVTPSLSAATAITET